jgi:hypothetical protein
MGTHHFESWWDHFNFFLKNSLTFCIFFKWNPIDKWGNWHYVFLFLFVSVQSTVTKLCSF